jgi:hypothetical protein
MSGVGQGGDPRCPAPTAPSSAGFAAEDRSRIRCDGPGWPAWRAGQRGTPNGRAKSDAFRRLTAPHGSSGWRIPPSRPISANSRSWSEATRWHDPRAGAIDYPSGAATRSLGPSLARRADPHQRVPSLPGSSSHATIREGITDRVRGGLNEDGELLGIPVRLGMFDQFHGEESLSWRL